MASSWICSQGHCWEDDASPAAIAHAVRCSICGEPGGPNPGATGLADHFETTEQARTGDEADVVRRRQVMPSIPGFEFLGQLGEGGMGAVFKARHLRLGRIVAVKVIREASMSPRLRVRFQIEAESLASLSHPHIVQIFDVGEFEDQPYIALEFVEGGTLRERLRLGSFAPRDAAQLVATLARAMHAAHERGIIHRDLKPDNVLLAADGTPKITDFGVAKRLLEDKPHTMTGMVVGTPAYMAPEQAAGEAHAASPLVDVFALGVILYELLTGRVPFDAPTAASMLHRLQTDEPSPPSRIEAKVPRDLEVICLKCLEKNPTRRYASAAAFANDLDRFLRHEPIEARPASLFVRTAKWMRRNPMTAALTIASSLFLVVLIGLTAWSYREIGDSRQQAERNLKRTREMLDNMYAKVTENWLPEDSQNDPLRHEFLSKTCTYYEEIAHQDGRDRELRQSQALAYYRLGDIYITLGKAAEASKPFDRAIALQQQLTRENAADLVVLQDLAKSYAKRGHWRWESKQPAADVERDFLEAQQIFERLADTQPNRHDYLGGLGHCLYNLGLVHQDAGKVDDAEKEFDRAIVLLTRSANISDKTEYRQDLARSHINLGVLNKSKVGGSFAAAERNYLRAIELLEPKEGQKDKPSLMIDLVVARQNLGNLYLSDGKSGEALAVLNKARDELEKLTSDYPKRPSYRKKLATTYNSLGSVFVQANNLDAAAKQWELARERLSRVEDGQPMPQAFRQELGVVLGNLGWFESEKKNWQEARKLVEQAVDHLRAAAQPNPKDALLRQMLCNQFRTLAEICLNLNEPEAAAAAAQDMADAFGDRPQDWYYAACFQARALVLIRDGQAAEQVMGKCLRCLSVALNTPSPIPDDRLARLDNEADVFAPLAAHPEGQKLLKTLKEIPK